MDLILDAISRWGARLQAAGRLVFAVVALVAAGGGLVLASHFVANISILSNTIGGLAGGAWFIAAYLVWEYILPEQVRERTWIRANYVLAARRRMVLWAFLAWAAILVFVGSLAGSPLLGALNVVVLLTLWRTFTLTAEERAELEAAANATEDTWSLPDGTTESDLDLEDLFGDELGAAQKRQTEDTKSDEGTK